MADIYFDRIATLRCLGFIHKPSFLQALDHGTLVAEYSEALIYIICAFAAQSVVSCLVRRAAATAATDHKVFCRFYWRDLVQTRPDMARAPLPGRAWAERAHSLIMNGIASPSLTKQMVRLG